MLAGGRSGEHEVSLASARAVREGLAQAGHESVGEAAARRFGHRQGSRHGAGDQSGIADSCKLNQRYAVGILI